MIEWFSQLSIFHWNFYGSCLASISLSLLGTQFAYRNKGTQVLAVIQSGNFGIALGLGVWFLFAIQENESFSKALLAISLGACFCLLCYLGLDKIEKKYPQTLDSVSMGIYAISLALLGALVAFVPQLESYHVTSLFGDIATASQIESQVVTFFSCACTIAFGWHWRLFSFNAFQFISSGLLLPTAQRIERRFVALAVIFLPISIFVFGSQFALSQLFIPAFLIRLCSVPHKHFWWSISMCSALGCSLGLLTSLYWDNVPSVPMVSIFTTLLCILTGFAFFASKFFSRNRGKFP